VPSLWYPFPSTRPSSICRVCDDRLCPLIFCFLGVDVAGMSVCDWIPVFICGEHSWPFPLWIAERAAHWSCSLCSFSGSSLAPFSTPTAANAVSADSADSASWSDPTTHGEGVRRSSAVSQDIIECWLSLSYPPPLSSSKLPLRSSSAKARVTRSPLLLISRKQLAESTMCTEERSSAWAGSEPTLPANFSQKPEEDLEIKVQ